MGIFNKKKVEEVRMTDTSKLVAFINNENYVNLNEENVLQISSIRNAIEVISGTVASLPINLYKEKNGNIKKIEKDDRLFLLNNEPSNFVQANAFKKDIIKDMLLCGKGYALLDKKGIKLDGLYNIKNSQMTVTDLVNNKGMITDKRYNFVLNNISCERNFFNILEVNYGKGILKENTEILATLMYISAYDNYIFKNAIMPSGVLETEGKLTEDVARGLKSQLENMYSGIKNFRKPMVLEQGLKWKSLNQNPNDLMLDKAKDNGTKEVERLFNLPYGFLNNSNNANVESQNLLFLQRTITPIIIALEEALNQSLLLESEKKQGFYFRFDVSELLKMTNDKLINFATLGLEKGIFTINEARKMMDLDPIENCDKLSLSLGNVLMDMDGNTEVFNMDGGNTPSEEPQDDLSVPSDEEVQIDPNKEEEDIEPIEKGI